MRVDKTSRDYQRRKKIYESVEEIKEMGQDDEVKASRVVNQIYKREEVEREGKRNYFLERLDGRKKYNDYTKLCAQITYFYLEEQDYPNYIKYTVQYDPIGVLMFVAVRGKVYQRSFRAVREPLYDLNACEVFAVSVGDLIPKKEDGFTTGRAN